MASKKKSAHKKVTKDISKNYWAVSTIFLAVLLVIVLINGSVSSGSAIGTTAAGRLVLEFFNNHGANAKLINTTDADFLYLVRLSIPARDGKLQEVPVYVTKDGKNLVPQLIPLKIRAATHLDKSSANVPKTDKPSVELYVFSYCPYGTQAEKGMIPVVKLLRDKIGFKIRQIGAMHGPHEVVEAKRQLCIEKEYPNSFLDYVLSFDTNAAIGACNSNASCSEPLVDAIYTRLGIDKNKIESCIKSDGNSLYAAEQANAKSHGVGGSPTLIINGASVQPGRDSASYLSAICSAFTTAPDECSRTLSSSSPSPGFGGSISGSSTTAQC